ncbi:MAG: hypothetical protein ACLFSQ_07490 [Candidatus Zixiibacteriota bacterium]
MFERIYAEALNLHNRFPMLCLGYVYMLPVIAYRSSGNKIIYGENYDIGKYLTSFSSISGRISENSENWKYDAICLLIIDFEKSPSQILHSLNEIDRIDKKLSTVIDYRILSIDYFFDSIKKYFSREISSI